MAQESLILTEDQLKALEKAKEEKQAHGEIETEHPGYLLSQDTYYVGTIKVLEEFTNRPSLTPILKWLLLNFMIEKML